MPNFRIEQNDDGTYDVRYGNRPLAYDREGYEVVRVIQDHCGRDQIEEPRTVDVTFLDGSRENIRPEYLS